MTEKHPRKGATDIKRIITVEQLEDERLRESYFSSLPSEVAQSMRDWWVRLCRGEDVRRPDVPEDDRDWSSQDDEIFRDLRDEIPMIQADRIVEKEVRKWNSNKPR